jgi:hypothetical protein
MKNIYYVDSYKLDFVVYIGHLIKVLDFIDDN